MSTSHDKANDRIALPPLLTAHTARRILDAMKEELAELRISVDLGLTEETVPLDSEEAYVFGLSISRKELKRIVKRDSIVFALDPDGPYPLELRDNGYAKLVPSEEGLGAPTFELSGIKMHRTKGIDPFNDARTKADAAVKRGDYVLDTCGGLGYTATWARRIGAAEVVSVEKNADVIALRRYNPWSQEYLRDGGIAKLTGSVVEHIKEYEDGYFDAIIHDPPRFSLAGDLYGEEFVWQMSNALGAGGRLVFYTGEPYKLGRGRNFIGGIEKRLHKARFIGEYNPRLQAIVAEKR